MSVQETRYEMSDEHKARLAEGREQSRIIRHYLDALRHNAPKRGRKRTPESVEDQIQRVKERITAEMEPLRKLHLMAERDRLVREKLDLIERADLTELENQFVRVAAQYSERKGISYTAWRSLGVPAHILRMAGISRVA